jgi:hypothetical protein
MQVLWSLYGPGELLPTFRVRCEIVAGRYRTLRDLAEKAGHSPASLADALGVDETTIYRHWVADDWLDRMQSHAIRKLMAVVPGIDQEYSRSVVQERVDQLINEGAAAGFEISGEAFSQAIERADIVPQFLCSATEAGLSILKGDQERSVRKLRSCWGRAQTWALHAIYGSAGTPPVFPDHEALIGASREMFDKLSSSRITYQRSIALGHLAHHLAAEIEMDIKSPARRRAGLRDEMAGFFVRSAFMASLRRSDDLDLAGRYTELVATQGAARLVELWTFPSWTGDLSPSADNFTVPHNLVLRNSAREVIHEIKNYNEVYAWYLVTTYVPLTLEQADATFGGMIDELIAALRYRAERAELTELRTACLELAGVLASKQGE